MSTYRRAGLIVGAAIASLALAAPAAQAQVNEGDLVATPSADGCTLTITATGQLHVSSQTVTAGLVVRHGDTVVVDQGDLPAEDGIHQFDASITVGPFDEDTQVEWRVFGGPVREHDSPAWDTAGHPDWADTVEDLEDAEGRAWTAGDSAEFVTWHEPVTVEGCPTPDPDPTTDPQPTTPPAKGGDGDAGKGGGDDPAAGDELPMTGLNTSTLVIIGAAAIGIGIGGVIIARRSRTILE